MNLYTDDKFIASVTLDRTHPDKTTYRATGFTRAGIAVNLMPRAYNTLDGLLRAARKRGIHVDTASANI